MQNCDEKLRRGESQWIDVTSQHMKLEIFTTKYSAAAVNTFQKTAPNGNDICC